jgi:HK97 family phage prohead protease
MRTKEVMGMAKKQLPRKDELAIRSFGMPDIRAMDEDGMIEGHAAVFEQKTNIGEWFNEVIERGAFDGCDFDDVLFTANHNMWEIPLARSRRNNSNSSLQLDVDERGLFVRAKLDLEGNAEAKCVHSAIKRGDINGMSFMFYVAEERWEDMDTDMPTRHVMKIAKVREVSAVNFPVYPGTDISARDQSALENARRAVETARSTLDNEKNEREALKLRAQIKLKG